MDSSLPQNQTCRGTKGPLIPGDPEREAEAIRSKEGIPLLKPAVNDLLDISKKTEYRLTLDRADSTYPILAIKFSTARTKASASAICSTAS